MTTGLILGTPSATAWRAYRAFIAAGVPESEVTAALRSEAPIVGSEAFEAVHRDAIEQAHPTGCQRSRDTCHSTTPA